jgi:2-oxoglutarate ferredoxin oxidoreductase subunit alpha
MTDVVTVLGGEAGHGIDSSGSGFARAILRAGYHVFAQFDYESRIRGGHIFYEIRASDQPLRANGDRWHILLDLDGQTTQHYVHRMAEGGAIVFDEQLKTIDEADLQARGLLALRAPLRRIAEETGGDKVMMNTALLGIGAGLSGLPLDTMEEIMRQNFARKSPELAEKNIAVAREARDWLLGQVADFRYRLPPSPGLKGHMLIDGNQAIVLGAVAAGCKFATGYPMTPWSSVLEGLIRAAPEAGMVVHQVEDEIAAIGEALGASWAGARAMTGSSGGGFALMVEHLSLAGMNEVPLVVVEVQRAGPATGLPTRDEQGDLLFILHAGHGDFPRIVLAPGNVEEAFDDMARAFNLAENYQCPVIVVSHHHLAGGNVDADPADFDLARVQAGIDRGSFLDYAALDHYSGEYARYRFTDDGISPRAVPGHPNALVHGMSDEHNEFGGITEDAENRRKMVLKRAQKLVEAQKEMRPPLLYGPREADLTFVSWGGHQAALKLAVDGLAGRANLLHFRDLYPIPLEAEGMLRAAKRRVLVESNSTGQLGRYLRMETGVEMDARILKWDGRPLTVGYILDQLAQIDLFDALAKEVRV